LRTYDAVIFVWWVWLFAPAYLTMIALMRRRTRVILQCHNVGDKEPAAWKRWLTNRVLRRADALVAHARTEADEAWKRSRGRRVVKTFLPVHELGGAIPPRASARATLGIDDTANVALFFGHIRPFKGLDIALRAWRELKVDALLVAAGEAWWERAEEYERLAREMELPVILREGQRDAEPELRDAGHHNRATLSPREDVGRGRHGAKRSAGEGSSRNTRATTPSSAFGTFSPAKSAGEKDSRFTVTVNLPPTRPAPRGSFDRPSSPPGTSAAQDDRLC
jgi:glycosyltransferase involved in cell wall biosynthesis